MIGTEKRLISLYCDGHCSTILTETLADVLRSELKNKDDQSERDSERVKTVQSIHLMFVNRVHVLLLSSL